MYDDIDFKIIIIIINNFNNQHFTTDYLASNKRKQDQRMITGRGRNLMSVLSVMLIWD